MWYLRHMGDNNLKLFLQQWCGRETFQMKYHTIYDMFTYENVLKPIPQWKLVYLNSFQTKYRGSSWFCTSSKIHTVAIHHARVVCLTLYLAGVGNLTPVRAIKGICIMLSIGVRMVPLHPPLPGCKEHNPGQRAVRWAPPKNYPNQATKRLSFIFQTMIFIFYKFIFIFQNFSKIVYDKRFKDNLIYITCANYEVNFTWAIIHDSLI